ncbi:hypothetical protein Sjap_019680 [Stephania japonica]|uniref:Uncharacterized protein n=1 Tax=Stephania japonica TaxID=461633 RepID=A0AAP0EZ93_9MAGN
MRGTAVTRTSRRRRTVVHRSPDGPRAPPITADMEVLVVSLSFFFLPSLVSAHWLRFRLLLWWLAVFGGGRGWSLVVHMVVGSVHCICVVVVRMHYFTKGFAVLKSRRKSPSRVALLLDAVTLGTLGDLAMFVVTQCHGDSSPMSDSTNVLLQYPWSVLGVVIMAD